jgi:hypothetical protein
VPLDSLARARLLLAATPLVPFVVLMPGGRWLLPAVAPLTLYVWFARRVRLGDYLGAWKIGMLWAGLLSLGVVALVYLLPGAAEAGILHGEPYRREMFGWIETGLGRENTPSLFIPEHLLHLGLFVLLTWASGGYLGLVLGAALVAYMSYFVGSYAATLEPVLLRYAAGPVLAWVPWSVLRVAAFVLLGAVFSRPLLLRRPWPFERREAQLLALALSGIVGDIVIKTFAAPAYGLFLRGLAGW